MQTPPAQPADPTAEPRPAEPRAASRSALLVVFLVVFIDLLGFGIVLPLLSVIAESYVERVVGVEPGARAATEGTVGLVIGLLMSSFSLMQFLFAPVWGRVSDRVGRRPILLLGLAGSVVFYLLFGYAASLPVETAAGLALALFFVARTGAGIAGATIATAQAVIADCTPPEKRKHGMALIGAAFGIGFTFGPLVGAGSQYLYPNRLDFIGYSAAGLSLLALALGLVLLPETRQFATVPPVRRKWLDRSALRLVLGNPAVAPVVLVFFMATLGFGGFETTLALLLKDAFGFEPRGSFLMFAYVGFVLLITQGVIYRRLAARVSEPTFMGLGILFMAGGVAALGAVSYFAHQPLDLTARPQSDAGRIWELPLLTPLLLGLTSAVVGFAFLTPSAQALISRRSPADRQGEVLGVNQSASALARILGPVTGVTLYKLTATHLLPYLFGAALLALMLPLLPRIRRG
jgi:MFS family permease